MYGRRVASVHNRRWRQLRAVVLERDGWICRICGEADAVEVDHIVRREDGGVNHPANLRSLCRPCHNARAVKPATQRAVFLAWGVKPPAALERLAAGASAGVPASDATEWPEIVPLRGDLTRR